MDYIKHIMSLMKDCPEDRTCPIGDLCLSITFDGALVAGVWCMRIKENTEIFQQVRGEFKAFRLGWEKISTYGPLDMRGHNHVWNLTALSRQGLLSAEAVKTFLEYGFHEL